MRYLIMAFFTLPLIAGDLSEAFENGKLLLDLRLRIETVEQGNLDEDAFAPTLRTRLGYQTAPLSGWLLTLELEDITAITDDDYNDTKNGNTAYPVVADPDDTEVNQVFLAWKAAEGRTLKLGRQRITLDNHRFIGNVGWRQNEQTFDGITWTESFGASTELIAGWIGNVNRIFGEHHPNPLNADWRTSSWLANLKLASLPIGDLVLFGYFLDFDDLPDSSHRDLGFRLTGKQKAGDIAWIYELSYADQADFGDGSDIIDAEYLMASAGIGWTTLSVTLNREILSGDGRYGFSTPLATLHGQNGWADIFLATPAEGLIDSFVKATLTGGDWKLTSLYHRFEADETSVDYGSELDVLATWKLNDHWDLVLKFADYQADTRASDTQKLWLWGHYKY